jgi:inositol oxygenase
MKEENDFRNYENVEARIRDTYRKARENQDLEYYHRMCNKYLKFDKKMKVHNVFSHLESFVDISDPDISLPNYYHGLQTAEAIKQDNHPDWFQLVGLIHDIGKIMFLWGCDKDGTSLNEQWGIVGDTFILGCKLPETIVFPEFNHLNKYSDSTELGIYKPGCGLDAVKCSWGHDEYLYQVLKYNNCPLPEEALYIIRFHSLYLFHKENEYEIFMNEKDKKMKKWVVAFNKYDLYTKSNSKPDESTKQYYNKLVDKYLNGGELMF